MKVDKAQRRAAGHVCLAMFHLSLTITHTLDKLTQLPTGTHRDTLGGGLSEKEREYVAALGAKFSEHGEVCRKLGWRLLKEN